MRPMSDRAGRVRRHVMAARKAVVRPMSTRRPCAPHQLSTQPYRTDASQLCTTQGVPWAVNE